MRAMKTLKPKPPSTGKRRSACAEATQRAESARLRAMTGEERIMLALDLRHVAVVLASEKLPPRP